MSCCKPYPVHSLQRTPSCEECLLGFKKQHLLLSCTPALLTRTTRGSVTQSQEKEATTQNKQRQDLKKKAPHGFWMIRIGCVALMSSLTPALQGLFRRPPEQSWTAGFQCKRFRQRTTFIETTRPTYWRYKVTIQLHFEPLSMVQCGIRAPRCTETLGDGLVLHQIHM